MNEFLRESVTFGILLTFTAYGIGSLIHRRFPYTFVNPLLIGVILVIPALLVLKVDYSTYMNGAKYISFLLTPATISLAVPLYEQFEILKKNYKAVLAGVLSGVLTALAINIAFALLLHFDRSLYISILPKNITTAVAIGVTEELGGVVAITTSGIALTGIFGNITAVKLLRLFGVTEPVAVGVACGTASHVIGTTRAMQIGELEGAVSSLSLVVSAIFTVIGISLVSGLIP